MNSIIKSSVCQQTSVILQENLPIECSEVLEKFQPKKFEADKISRLLAILSQSEKDKASEKVFVRSSSRMSYCSHYLSFGQNCNSDGTLSEKVLKTALFCHDRVCPLCSWRKSVKLFAQMAKASSLIVNDYKFALLTLTVPNVTERELSESISKLLHDFNLFFKYKDIKSIVKGYFRSLELTYNDKTDTFHPHIHAIIALPKSYGSKLYLSRDKLLQLWRRACKDDRITQLDIRLVKPNNEKSFVENLAEVAKYTLKTSDFLYKKKDLPNGKRVLTDEPLPIETSLKVLRAFVLSLRGVRCYGSSGVWKKALSDIQSDDFNSENIDLVHITEDKKLNPALPWLITIYRWIDGYKVSEIYIEPPEEHFCNMKKSE